MDMNVKISLCMIVKNEEDVLARCLRSVARYVDEIIIVDTGSTDNTKKICRRFTDKIFDFEWIDDFAAARNFSFSKAAGDYLMWLDADDVISEENAARLSALKERLAETAPDVVMSRYVTSSDENGEPVFSFFRERLLKRTSNFRWEGFIHECIAPRGKIVYSDFTVHHRKERNAGDRNLRIFQKKISQGVRLDARSAFYYGRELFYNKMYTESAAVLERAIDMGLKNNLNEACLFLFDSYNALGETQKAMLALFKSLEKGTPRADILCKLAGVFKSRRDYETAAFWYEAATKCSDLTKRGEFDRSEYRTVIPFIELSCCYFYMGDKQRASVFHEKAKALRPNHPSVVFNEKFFGGQ